MLAGSTTASTPLLAAGLQEWAACCHALLAGRLVLVVRKGGIHERHGGGFTLAHRRFALLPTHLHQRDDRLRGDIAASARTAPPPSPGTLEVAGWAEAAGVWQVRDLARILALDGELAFTPAELEARFRYRGQPWLFLLALRVHRLAQPQRIPDLPRYAGCVSWIELAQGIDPCAARPVLADGAFAARMAGISRLLGDTGAAGGGAGA